MHGRNMASKAPVRLLPRSPERLLAAPAQRSEGRRSASLGGAGSSKRPFAPLWRLTPFGTHRNRISAPGLSLRRLAVLPPDPFGSELASSRPFPVRGEGQRSWPVIGLPFSFLSPLSGDRSLLGVPALQIKAPRRLRIEGLTLASGPLSLRSPEATARWLSSLPDHRSRLATVRQARCSVNLLEPLL